MQQRSSSRGPVASANRLRVMTASRRIARLPLVLIRLAAICVALVLIAGVVQAQTPSVLTSNTGLTPYASDVAATAGVGALTHTRSLHGTSKFAQRFFTGTDTNGYTLTSIGINFEQIHDPSVAGAELEMTIRPRISEGRGIGKPGDAVCTLDDPATFTASGVQTFTVPTTCPNLAANSHYYAVLSRVSGAGVVYVHRTPTVDRAHSGWAVINNAIAGVGSISRNSGWTDCPCQYMIEISGNRVGGM